MIRYALKCSQGHDFESWFQSAAAYEKLSDAGMISCSTCGDGSVKKALMAPPVSAPGEVEAPFPLKGLKVNVGTVKDGKITIAATGVDVPDLSKW